MSRKSPENFRTIVAKISNKPEMVRFFFNEFTPTKITEILLLSNVDFNRFTPLTL